MNDGIVTKLEFLLKEGAAIIKEQADEIERLRGELQSYYDKNKEIRRDGEGEAVSDDIVTRLRMSADLMVGFPKMLAKNTPSQWLFEAADEIERLRDALIECEFVISRLKIEKNYTDGL